MRAWQIITKLSTDPRKKREKSINCIRRSIAEIAAGIGVHPSDVIHEIEATNWEEWVSDIEQKKRNPYLAICEYCQRNVPRPPMAEYGNYSPLICDSCMRRFQEEEEIYNRTPQPCIVCNGSHTPLELLKVQLPKGDFVKTCPVNPDCELDAYRLTCLACDSRYLPFHSKQLCNTCWEGPVRNEWTKVSNQNTRAQKYGMPATLNIKQWLAVIEHFKNKCSYCNINDYTDMEHYIPIEIAGTTVNNCLPACGRCNSKKHNRHPDQLDSIFPAENLARIRQYLSEQSA